MKVVGKKISTKLFNFYWSNIELINFDQLADEIIGKLIDNVS